MELRHLRYFVVVAQTLNFRVAADKLRVSHPALSKQIRDLEYELGTPLLGRNTVAVWLTAPGKRFLAEAKAILAHVDAAVKAVKNEAVNDNALTIAGVGRFWDAVLHNLLKRFRLKHPEIDVRMVDRLPWKQIEGLQRGEFQLGFVGKREKFSGHTISRKLLMESAFGVVLGVDHPLAQRNELRWEDIRKEKIYGMGPVRTSNHIKDIRNILPADGSVRRQIHPVESIDSLVAMVTSCQGISLVPEAFVESRKNSVRFLPLVDAREECKLQLWAVWRANDVSKPLRAFIDMLEAITDSKKGTVF